MDGFFEPGIYTAPIRLIFGNDNTNIKGILYKLITAEAHTFGYQYEYIVDCIERMNSSEFYETKPPEIPTPTRLEFLECLEFRKSEFERIYNILENGKKLTSSELQWRWPSSWNRHSKVPLREIHHYLFLYSDDKIDDCTVRSDIRKTENAIYLQRKLLGDNTLIDFDWNRKDFIKTFHKIIPIKDHIFPDYIIFKSLEIPVHITNYLDRDEEQEERIIFDIDNILGDYKKTRVRLFVRMIEWCAEKLNLNKYHLEDVIIIHELSHWCAEQFIPNVIDDNDIDEVWAQLITYFVINEHTYPSLNYDKDNDDFNLSDVSKSLGIAQTFVELLKNQSTTYNKFKEVLKVCNDLDLILDSLKDIEKQNKKITFNEYLVLLKNEKALELVDKIDEINNQDEITLEDKKRKLELLKQIKNLYDNSLDN